MCRHEYGDETEAPLPHAAGPGLTSSQSRLRPRPRLYGTVYAWTPRGKHVFASLSRHKSKSARSNVAVLPAASPFRSAGGFSNELCGHDLAAKIGAEDRGPNARARSAPAERASGRGHPNRARRQSAEPDDGFGSTSRASPAAQSPSTRTSRSEPPRRPARPRHGAARRSNMSVAARRGPRRLWRPGTVGGRDCPHRPRDIRRSRALALPRKLIDQRDRAGAAGRTARRLSWFPNSGSALGDVVLVAGSGHVAARRSPFRPHASRQRHAKIDPWRQVEVDPLADHGSSVVPAGRRPRSRSLSR